MFCPFSQREESSVFWLLPIGLLIQAAIATAIFHYVAADASPESRVPPLSRQVQQ
ncbi:MAG TPA: hypothetical protein IGS53_06200 [Leptolyngbyaceae cyanobacterium M33_DOE_097]|nr:hypothetical protein [Leptolyngbyaceae cyanobacterium M33_DOE_097]